MRHHVSVELLHHEERRADHGVVVAHGEHRGDARGVAHGADDPCLAQHVVRAGRKRRPRRAPDHALPVAAPHDVGHVRVALADRRRLDRSLAEAVLVEESLERLGDEQGRPVVPLRFLEGADDVVRRVPVHAHSVAAPPAAAEGALPDQPGNDRAVQPPSTRRTAPLQ